MARSIEQLAEILAKELTESDAIRRQLKHEEIDVEGKTATIERQLVILFTKRSVSPATIGTHRPTGLGSHLPNRSFEGMIGNRENRNNGQH